MEKRSVVFAIILTTSSVLGQYVDYNRRILDQYCTPGATGFITAPQAFNSICAGRYNLGVCCQVVAQDIQAYPNLRFCLTNDGYVLSAIECGQTAQVITNRNSFSEEPTPSKIHFPTEPNYESQVNLQYQERPLAGSSDHVIKFSNDPASYVYLKNPAAQQPQVTPNRGTQNAGTSVNVARNPANQPPKIQKPMVVKNPVPNYEDDDFEDEEEHPAVQIDTPGYIAMDFALKLFKNLDRSANVDSVISPLLPQQLLMNLVDVASPLAKSQLQNTIRIYPEQMDKLTNSLQKVSKSTVNTIEFATVNFVAKDVKLNPTYKQNSVYRNIQLLNVDFNNPEQAARIANNWVSNKTHRLINEIINPGSVNPFTRLLLANTIFFKGQWKYSFIQTEPGKFESSPGKFHQVNSMFQLNKLRYGELNFKDGNGLRWVELPYEGEGLAMLIFLPTNRHQLEASLRQMTSQDLAKVMAEMQKSYINTKVNLHLPRFTLTDSVSLIPALQRLGVTSIFQDKDALRNLANEAMLVSDVTQRTYLSVDELGTKATSVASLSIITLSITPQYTHVQFDVDQPFLAMIVDKQQRYPIFIGQIYDPRE